MTAAEALAAVKRAERSGDYLAAFDLASRALDELPEAGATGDGLALRHRAVLALARSGATRRARALFSTLGLDGNPDPEVAALDARLAKDAALAAPAGDERARLARIAAERYAAVHARSGGHYPAVNAATMYRIAGDRETSDRFARAALAAAAAPAEGMDAYWATCSAAEAQLLLGETDAAHLSIYRALAANRDDHAARATTLRQLGILRELLGLPAHPIDMLKPPQVIHYTGHRIAPPGEPGRFPAEREADMARATKTWTLGTGYGFGALAAGADILVAEALLAHGAELHVVLPCGDDEFIRKSVYVGGADDARWEARFRTCLAAATTVTHATPDEVSVDDELFRYASRLAMGLALLRARHLMTDALQVAIWDGEQTTLRAGTYPDIATWQAAGHQTIAIAASSAELYRPTPDAPPLAMSEPTGTRRVRAMLFGDIKGFSKLAEAQVPTFVDAVLGAFGRVLDGFGDAIEERNTWGDGIYIVIREPATAARVALALQAALDGIDLRALGLPPHLALRLGGHVGPVYALADAVARRGSHFGTHVTRTARIEPVTPEGEVFVTEAFAAALALDDRGFRCEYVGHMPAAKGFGAMRMHSLRRGTTEGT